MIKILQANADDRTFAQRRRLWPDLDSSLDVDAMWRWRRSIVHANGSDEEIDKSPDRYHDRKCDESPDDESPRLLSCLHIASRDDIFEYAPKEYEQCQRDDEWQKHTDKLIGFFQNTEQSLAARLRRCELWQKSRDKSGHCSNLYSY
jgi:hypothetical protein